MTGCFGLEGRGQQQPQQTLAGRGASPAPRAPQPSHGERGFVRVFFSPTVRNWANLLFVSHMGSQMDGEEGVGSTDARTDRSGGRGGQQQAVLAGRAQPCRGVTRPRSPLSPRPCQGGTGCAAGENGSG